MTNKLQQAECFTLIGYESWHQQHHDPSSEFLTWSAPLCKSEETPSLLVVPIKGEGLLQEWIITLYPRKLRGTQQN